MMRSEEILAIIVMPCFNESNNLAESCCSLGFGLGASCIIDNTILVLVDNASTDLTSTVAEEIKRNSPPETVYLGFEKERGYVPPRHKGNLIAQAIAENKGRSLDEVLVIQVDADTKYSPNYVKLMKWATLYFGANTLIEGRMNYSDAFIACYSHYISLSNSIDTQLARFFVISKTYDVIIDDKVAAYRLCDYFKWGNHIREFLDSDNELFAETSRLYIKARVHGARKVLLTAASGIHSERRILEDPFLSFATAGFPREASWRNQFNKDISKSKVFLNDFTHRINDEIISIRKLHVAALFCILPYHVNKTLGVKYQDSSNRLLKNVFPRLPLRSRQEIRNAPGSLISDVFELIDRHSDIILNSLAE